MKLSSHGAAIAALLGALMGSPGRTNGQTETADTLPRYSLEGVTVTATRAPVERAEIPQRLDLLRRADLARTGTRELGQALRAATPLDVIEYPGLLTGVSLRGFRPQISGTPRTLLLVDGRPAGTNNLALLQGAGVDRVEVLRGPASALYGSSAMGGVVNVITRRSAGPVQGDVLLDYGTFGGYRVDATVGGSLTTRAAFDASFSGGGQSAGYRPGRSRTFGSDSLTKTLSSGGTVSLPWETSDTTLTFSEHRAGTASARGFFAISEVWTLEARGEVYRADQVQNPGDLAVRAWDSRTLKDVGRGSADLRLVGAVKNHQPSLLLFTASERIDYYDAPEAPHFVSFRTPARTSGAQLQDLVRIGGHTVTLGLDRTVTRTRSEAFLADGSPRAPYSPDVEVGSTALFGQGRFAVIPRRFLLTAGARLDRIRYEVLETPNLAGYAANREHHLILNPSGGARLEIVAGLRVYGNAGRAFVTPDPFQVAGYSESRSGLERRAVSVARGNSDLRAESSWGWDLGLALERAERGFELDLAVFGNEVRDRIVRELVSGDGTELTAAGDTVLSTTTFRNADRARIRGVEWRFAFDAGHALRLGRSVRLLANATRILEATEQLGASTAEKRIPNVARSTIVSRLEVETTSRSTVRVTSRYVGQRVDDDYVEWWAPGEIRYPPYFVVDLDAATALGDRYRLSVGVRNILDEDYFEVRGYNLPGRSAWAGIRIGI